MHDFHTHFIPADVLNWLKDNKNTVNVRWNNKEGNKDDCLVINDKWGFELKPALINSELYLQEQEKAGITYSMLSPLPQLFLYDSIVDISTEIAEVYNRSLSQLVNSHPERLAAVGTVPLTHPVKAAQVLRDAIGLGLKGAIIGPGLGQQMLSDIFFKPFLEEANRLKAILFIHPLLSEDPRLRRKMMPSIIGSPWETTICATDLLLSGIVDQYPDIKFVFAHGGGFLPYQIGRLDKGYEQWELVSSNLQAPPSEYARRFWYDSVLWNQDSLDFLIQTVGEDRVVLGTDSPFESYNHTTNTLTDKGAHSLLDFIVK